jgi:hypothetical protein
MLVGGVESVFEGAAHLATSAIGEGIAYLGEHVFGGSSDDSGGDASGADGAGGASSGDGTEGSSPGYDSSADGGASDGDSSGGGDDTE